MHRLVVKAFDNQIGITIIETSIMPFAFFVADEVFNYLALSAGLFSTQKVRGDYSF